MCLILFSFELGLFGLSYILYKNLNRGDWTFLAMWAPCCRRDHCNIVCCFLALVYRGIQQEIVVYRKCIAIFCECCGLSFFFLSFFLVLKKKKNRVKTADQI